MRTVEAASRHCFGVPPISSTAADVNDVRGQLLQTVTAP